MRVSRRVSRHVVCLAVVVALLALSGCSGSQGTRSGGPRGAVVVIKDLQFRPAVIRIKRGATVTWRNEDTTAHTSTSANIDPESTGTPPPGSWDSPVIDRGGSWKRRFDRVGRFPYGCSIHPYIKGMVVVTP